MDHDARPAQQDIPDAKHSTEQKSQPQDGEGVNNTCDDPKNGVERPNPQPDQETEDNVGLKQDGDKEAEARNSTEENIEFSKNDALICLDGVGKRGMAFPWSQLKSWTDLKEVLIRTGFPKDKEARRRIREDDFRITLDGFAVSSETWPSVINQIRYVDIKFPDEDSSDNGSKKGSDAESDDEKDDEPTKDQSTAQPLDEKVCYTVNYNEQNRYTDRKELLWSKTLDDPPRFRRLWKTSKALPVLEEVQGVLCPTRDYDSDNDNPRKKKASRKSNVLSPGDKILERYLKINSPNLLNALRVVMKYTSTMPSNDAHSDSLSDGLFHHPYRELYHHKNDLIQFKEDISRHWPAHEQEYNDACCRHIDLLVKYLHAQPDIKLKECEARWTRTNPMTDFLSYWLLLKPGEDVYFSNDGTLDAYVVERVRGGVTFSNEGRFSSAAPYKVDLWNMWFDGDVISRRSREVTIPVFDSERFITSLPVFPTRFHDSVDDGKQRKALIDRGRKFFECCKGATFMEYTGKGERGSSEYQKARVVIDHTERPWGRVIEDLDISSDLEDQKCVPGSNARAPACECSECAKIDNISRYLPVTFSDYDDIDPKEQEELTEHQLLLCARKMYGYVLKDKAYELCNLEGLSKPTVDEKAIDYLVMKIESSKDAIKAIVKTYTDRKTQKLFSADFIHGKGEGQIILLHGPPGTGKTLTAESVAEYVRRPLLSIGAADLGHEPREVEANLLRFFRKANRWDSVVLLDEADVYLERRDTNDLPRNSIVSVFLRAMEYFQGILFLTTNRVGHIDEAFQSRIHISIGYPSLDDAAREQIWDNLFRKLREDFKNGNGPKIEYDWDAKNYAKKDAEMKKLQWNGREIRNAFQTVVALAIFDAKQKREASNSASDEVVPEIREKHIQQVVNMSKDFRLYMLSAHANTDDADLAFQLGNRDDLYHGGASARRRTVKLQTSKRADRQDD